MALKAWEILDLYLKYSLTGYDVLVELVKLSIGDEWMEMLDCVMRHHPDSNDSDIWMELNKMKPTMLALTLTSNFPSIDSPSVEVLSPPSLTSQTSPWEVLNGYLFSSTGLTDAEDQLKALCAGQEWYMMPVTCIMQSTSLSQRCICLKNSRGYLCASIEHHHSLAVYFQTIYGFLYCQQPVISHKTGSFLPLLFTSTNLAMPIHQCIVGLDLYKNAKQSDPSKIFLPGTWVIAN